jgi:hypothetical protein
VKAARLAAIALGLAAERPDGIRKHAWAVQSARGYFGR